MREWDQTWNTYKEENHQSNLRILTGAWWRDTYYHMGVPQDERARETTAKVQSLFGSINFSKPVQDTNSITDREDLDL